MKAAQDSFVQGVDVAAGVGAVVLLSAAVAAWFLLRGQELATSPAPAATAALSAAGPKPGHGSGPAPGGPAERP